MTKNRILITITDNDLGLLDELAEQAERSALWRKTGYRPAVIERMLDIIRASNLTPEEFMTREYILSQVSKL
jgi:hypothetical protein